MPRALSYSAAAKLIEKGATPLCLFLYGPEDYLKEDLLRRAEAKLVAPGMKSFNFSTFDLTEGSLSDALAAAEAFPALGGARMVVIRNAERLSRSKSDRELLKTRLAEPPGSLALFMSAGDIDRKASVLGSLPGAVKPVLLRSFDDRDMDAWVTSKAAAMGLKLTPAAKGALLALSGGTMWQVSNELEKLKVNVGERDEVTDGDVRDLVPGTSRHSALALADAVREGDRRGAAKIASELLKLGEAPASLTALLSSVTFRSWASRGASTSSDSPRAREFRRRALLLCEADSALKRSKLDPALALQLMVDALTMRRR
jgi:DNA polymerase-3 subunit delta